MRVTLIFEDIEGGVGDWKKGTVLLSVLPEHQCSADQLAASPAAMLAKFMVKVYEDTIRSAGGTIHEPSQN